MATLGKCQMLENVQQLECCSSNSNHVDFKLWSVC